MKARTKVLSVVVALALQISIARADEYQAMISIWSLDSSIQGICSYVYPACFVDHFGYAKGYYIGAYNEYASLPCSAFSAGCSGQEDLLDTFTRVIDHCTDMINLFGGA
jgi:hypothetical protein